MEMIELRVVEGEYPNGSIFGTFYLGRHEIGRAAKTPAGWIPNGKRKALSEVMAAKAMIDTMFSKAENDRKHARRLLNDLRLHNGGSLSPHA